MFLGTIPLVSLIFTDFCKVLILLSLFLLCKEKQMTE